MLEGEMWGRRGRKRGAALSFTLYRPQSRSRVGQRPRSKVTRDCTPAEEPKAAHSGMEVVMQNEKLSQRPEYDGG